MLLGQTIYPFFIILQPLVVAYLTRRLSTFLGVVFAKLCAIKRFDELEEAHPWQRRERRKTRETLNIINLNM